MSDRIFVVQVQNIMRDDATGEFLWGRGSMFLTPEDAERDRAYRARTYGAEHVRVVPYVPADALAAMTAERDALRASADSRDSSDIAAAVDRALENARAEFMRLLPDGGALVASLVAERDALRAELDLLKALRPADPGFDARMAALSHNLEAYLDAYLDAKKEPE